MHVTMMYQRTCYCMLYPCMCMFISHASYCAEVRANKRSDQNRPAAAPAPAKPTKKYHEPDESEFALPDDEVAAQPVLEWKIEKILAVRKRRVKEGEVCVMHVINCECW